MDEKKKTKSNIFGDFEERFLKMSEEQAAERAKKRSEIKRRSSSDSVSVSADGTAAASYTVKLYKAREAALHRAEKKHRRIGAVKRTVRLVRAIREAKAKCDSMEFCSAENRRAEGDTYGAGL